MRLQFAPDIPRPSSLAHYLAMQGLKLFGQVNDIAKMQCRRES